MEPNPETAPIVRLIFELAVEFGNTPAIRQALFDRKIPTPGEYKAAKCKYKYDVSRCGGIWQISTLLNILRDERYTGTYIIGKREVTEVGGHHVRMKDESQWVKIPDHHPAVISKELFTLAQSAIRQTKSEKKHLTQYPLKGKVFCGCCRHGMQRTGNKSFRFACTHSNVDASAPCHGLIISEGELEHLLYEILHKQAQAILNLADSSHIGPLDMGLTKQSEYGGKIEEHLEQKRVLYERFLLKQISLEDYKYQKAAVDNEVERLRAVYSNLKEQTMRMEMDEKKKRARTELALGVVRNNGLTAELVDSLIDRVYIYPGNQVEIVWKTREFCVEDLQPYLN